jgi:hypothetical protein
LVAREAEETDDLSQQRGSWRLIASDVVQHNRCRRDRKMVRVSEKGHGGRHFQQCAACMLLQLAVAGGSAPLAGCSGIAATNEELAPLAPEPSYRDTIATHLKATFKNFSSYDSFELSDPRWVHTVKGWNWITCVRFQDRGHLRTYTVYHNGGKIIDDRYAVQTDNCGTQAYYPFERLSGGAGGLSGVSGGLEPLH